VRDVGVAVLKVGVLFRNGNKTAEVKFFHSAYLRESDKFVRYISQLSSTDTILYCFSFTDTFLQVYDTNVFPYTR
jgi:hypothetical protein